MKWVEPGDEFDRLTVTAYHDHDPERGVAVWACDCQCGTRGVLVRQDLLAGGKAKSCGCIAAEKRGPGMARTTAGHGLSHTREWNIWNGIVRRCTDERVKKYPEYGGRGIRVCERWLLSFEAFLADLGPAPSAGHSVDRVDPNGHYEPDNCRWADDTEQANNRRSNRKVEYAGRTLTIAEWARETGLKPHTIRARLERGWPPERALTEPA